MAERTPSITSPSLSEGVDISPISTTDRRNSLEKHLQTRPDEQDLKNRHILLDTNTAPALQARQLELERQRATDNLKKGLEKRPERGELVGRKCCLCFLHEWFLPPLVTAGRREHHHIPYVQVVLCSRLCLTLYHLNESVVTPSALPPWHFKISSLDYVTPLRPHH